MMEITILNDSKIDIVKGRLEFFYEKNYSEHLSFKVIEFAKVEEEKLMLTSYESRNYSVKAVLSSEIKNIVILAKYSSNSMWIQTTKIKYGVVSQTLLQIQNYNINSIMNCKGNISEISKRHFQDDIFEIISQKYIINVEIRNYNDEKIKISISNQPKYEIEKLSNQEIIICLDCLNFPNISWKISKSKRIGNFDIFRKLQISFPLSPYLKIKAMNNSKYFFLIEYGIICLSVEKIVNIQFWIETYYSEQILWKQDVPSTEKFLVK